MGSATDSRRDGGGKMSILLTNDDGIEDYERRLLPLAKAFAAFARVTVVVSSQDRSGSTHYTSCGIKKRVLESTLVCSIEEKDGAGPIEVHSVEGYPADCVYLGLRGILRHEPPDVVVSGLNGGPNLGGGWLHSGTIGAARIAAVLGVPAVAVSGVDFTRDGDIGLIADWLAELVRTPLVRRLDAGQYLTVGIPRGRLDEVRGLRFAPRSPSLGTLEFQPAEQLKNRPGAPPRTAWLMQPPTDIAEPTPGSDIDFYRQRYIVVTPMRADEHDYDLLAAWADRAPELPSWGSE
ncbi:MAG: 5'/3'-nucleotidase SurE [Acidobacteriota bacterium]